MPFDLERTMRAAVSVMIKGRAPRCGNPATLNPDHAMDYVQWSEGYAERGYDQPKRGILFANWNGWPRELTDVLERAGYAIEWSDEWATCDDCNRAVRTSPDSYGWQKQFTMPDDCTILCRECTDWPEYLKSIEDNEDKAVPSYIDPTEYGYVRLSEADAFASGWHPGQTDTPAEVLAKAQTEGKKGILFRVSDVGQFDVHFETWIREAVIDPCECSDQGCPAGHGSEDCGKPSTERLYRDDMTDREGCALCDVCGSDALDSGVFTTRSEES